LGQELGIIWEKENLSVILAGNLAHCQARALVVKGQVTPITQNFMKHLSKHLT
jgi:hypothetical protein